MRNRDIVIAAFVVHLVPVAAWAAFKPVRVLAPELLGLHCSAHDVCVDELSRLAEATALKEEAVAFVNQNVGSIQRVPRTVFCSTSQCCRGTHVMPRDRPRRRKALRLRVRVIADVGLPPHEANARRN